jgi:acetyl-CoA carboxylase carboxyl transferase subunit beta
MARHAIFHRAPLIRLAATPALSSSLPLGLKEARSIDKMRPCGFAGDAPPPQSVRMSWLTEFVRPKIRTLFTRREVPDNLWHQCPACQQMIFARDLAANLKVCTHCGHHMRASAAERLTWTFDANAFTRIELPKVASDPLRFRDSKRYPDRLKDARDKTHMEDAVAVAHGTIEGRRAVVAAMEFDFIGGSMGAAVGEGIVAAARLAVLQDAPLIVFTASGGARMQEGAISLMQMPKTVIATRLVKDAGLPFIVVLTDPTTGGVTASFAMLGDIQIAEPGALIGFAGARVIEQTVHEKLPEGFQTAEYLHQHGMIDMVVKRTDLRATLARLLDLLQVKQREPAPPEPTAQAAE